jgi:uracil-DNA glycosylase family 4
MTARTRPTLSALSAEIAACHACPRLVRCRERAAAAPPRRFAGETYWARGVPGFGDAKARVVLVGLAPAANGANRTGRVFTGDRSGDWLYAALHRAGLANRAASTAAGDGLVLRDAYVACVVRCAPPGNRPTPIERDRCIGFLARELALLRHARAVVALGAFAWDGAIRALHAGRALPRPRPRFGHGAVAAFGDLTVFGCYHVSQRNTFTGKLTAAMLDAVLARATGHATGSSS